MWWKWKAFHVTIRGNFLEIKKQKKIYWPFFGYLMAIFLGTYLFLRRTGKCAEWTGLFNLPLCLVKGVFVGHLDLYH